MGKFVAEIPLPVGENGIAALDLSEIGIDVIEQDPLDFEKNRTIWATKILGLHESKLGVQTFQGVTGCRLAGQVTSYFMSFHNPL